MKMLSRVVPIVIVVVAGLFAASEWERNLGPAPGAAVSASETGSGTFSATLVRVFDGDSLIVRSSSGKEIEIRIHAIDAPERHQPFADRSRDALRELLEGETIVVDQHSRDRYDRVLAKLLIDGRDVGLAQIEAGLAWHYSRYAEEQSSQDRKRYAAAQKKARAGEVGLWGGKDPVEPWEYRQRQFRQGL